MFQVVHFYCCCCCYDDDDDEDKVVVDVDNNDDNYIWYVLYCLQRMVLIDLFFEMANVLLCSLFTNTVHPSIHVLSVIVAHQNQQHI